MYLRVLLVLTLTIIAVAQLADDQCNVEPKDRKNCGYERIMMEECKKMGCCFDSSIRGTYWCFYSLPSTTSETTTQRTTSVYPGNGTMNASYPGGMTEVPWYTTGPMNTTHYTNKPGHDDGIGMAEVPLPTKGPEKTTDQTTLSGNTNNTGVTEKPLPPSNTNEASSVGPLWSQPSYICLISVLLTTIVTMFHI